MHHFWVSEVRQIFNFSFSSHFSLTRGLAIRQLRIRWQKTRITSRDATEESLREGTMELLEIPEGEIELKYYSSVN